MWTTAESYFSYRLFNLMSVISEDSSVLRRLFFISSILFYRYISNDFVRYIENGDPSIDYANMSDDDSRIVSAKETVIAEKGYFIYPSQLFHNVMANIDSYYINRLDDIFISKQNNLNQGVLKDMFPLFSAGELERIRHRNRLNGDVIYYILDEINKFNIDDYIEAEPDVYGRVLRGFMQRVGEKAGLEGRLHFTPEGLSKLMTSLLFSGKEYVNGVFDFTCGAGNIFADIMPYYQRGVVDYGFFGQEEKTITYLLTKQMLIMLGLNHSAFSVKQDDALSSPTFYGEKFDAIITDINYSKDWHNDNFIWTDRFLWFNNLPQSKADYPFVLNGLAHLSDIGRYVTTIFSGALIRGGAEGQVRKYLFENHVESIIFPRWDSLFPYTNGVVILVLTKQKKTDDIYFMNINKMFNDCDIIDYTDINVAQNIAGIINKREEIQWASRIIPMAEIAENNYVFEEKLYMK